MICSCRSAASCRCSICCSAASRPAASARASTASSCSRSIAVFVAGLMVGRTPEYLGKKIETREMKLAMLAVLIYPLTRARLLRRLGACEDRLSTVSAIRGSARAHRRSSTPSLRPTPTTARPSRVSAATRSWFNTTLGLAMFLGRFAYVVPVLALAGSFAAKKKAPASAGTFPTHGPLFVGLLLGVIVILYLLQYFPALALGPSSNTSCCRLAKTF